MGEAYQLSSFNLFKGESETESSPAKGGVFLVLPKLNPLVFRLS